MTNVLKQLSTVHKEIDRGALPLRVIAYCLLVSFLVPNYLHDLNEATKLIDQGLRACGSLFALFLLISKFKANRSELAIFAFVVYMALSTLAQREFSGEYAVRFVSVYLDILAVVILAGYLIREKAPEFLSVMNSLAWVGLIANLCSIVLFPHGILQVANEVGSTMGYYLYGYDNRFITLYAPSLAIIYARGRLDGGRSDKAINARLCIATALCLLSTLLTGSVATSVALAACLILIIARGSIKCHKCAISVSWIVFCALSFALASGYFDALFGYFIGDIGKTTSLYVREVMWTRALELIPGSLVFGTGVMPTWIMRGIFGYAILHNAFLNTLLWGGAVGLVLYSIYLFSIERDLLRCGNPDAIKVMSILIATCLIASLFDSLELTPGIYLLFSIASNLQVLDGFGRNERKECVMPLRNDSSSKRYAPLLLANPSSSLSASKTTQRRLHP